MTISSPSGVLSQLKMKVETGTEEVSRIEAAKTELQAQVRSKPVKGSPVGFCLAIVMCIKKYAANCANTFA